MVLANTPALAGLIPAEVVGLAIIDTPVTGITTETEIATVSADVLADRPYLILLNGKVSADGANVASYTAGVWLGSVGSGTKLTDRRHPTDGSTNSTVWPLWVPRRHAAPTTGNQVFSIGLGRTGSTSISLNASSSDPAEFYILHMSQ